MITSGGAHECQMDYPARWEFMTNVILLVKSYRLSKEIISKPIPANNNFKNPSLDSSGLQSRPEVI